MQSIDFKKFLPHLYIILGFIVLSFLFGYPQLDGLVLSQGDHIQWKGMAKEGMDWYEKTGENVMWSNSQFGGMPTYTFYVAKVNNFVYPIQDGIMGVLGKPAGFLFLAMLGFYILALTFGFNRWLCIAGAVAYAFSTYNITLIEAGHDTKMWALCYVPVVMSGIVLLYRGRWWIGIPTLGIAMAFLMTTAHYQVMYYAIFIILGMVITFFINALKEKQFKRFFIASAVALVVAAIGIGPNMQIFLATAQYNKTTMRGGESELTLNHDNEKKKGGGLDKDYAFLWSNAWGESFTVLVPYLYGGASREGLDENSETYDALTELGVSGQQAASFAYSMPTYWGPQPFTGGPFYFGAIICFLFVLSFLVVKSNHKWWILAVCLLAFVMSTGKHSAINYFLFDTLPGLNKFRVPNMILTIPQLLFPFFAIWGLNEIISKDINKEELWKKVKISGIFTGGLCLLLAFGGSAFFEFKGANDAAFQSQLVQSFGNNEQAANKVMSALRSDRASMATQSGMVSVVFILIMVGMLWAYYKGKLKGMHMAMALIVLVAIDLIRIDSKYISEENYQEPEAIEAALLPRTVDQQILADKDPYYRVLDLSVNTNNNAMQAAHHKCIGGYSPTKMEAYQDMIDIHLAGGGYNREVLNMLNTKYIISGQGPNGQPVAIPNVDACGNAWFVEDIQWTETADEEMLALTAEKLGDMSDTTENMFRPKETAVLRTSYKDELSSYKFGKDSAAVVKLDQYGLNNISFYSKNSTDGFAVFSDIYYPYGWKAYVDGKETPIYKANYLLRALKLPAGEHKIEFKFRPERFYLGDNIAMVSCVLLILMVLGSVFMAFKEHSKKAA